jgi:uncharacterized protein YdeI (YjbR/CyaY-like superfamily)
MPAAETPLHFETRKAWRAWLARNHARVAGIWMLYYKKHTGRLSLAYADAVEEALCFGWIDGKIRRLDGATYMQRYTPRSERSIWSELNRRRAQRMIRRGLMTAAGLVKIRAAKKSGAWEQATRPRRPPTLPTDLRRALAQQPEAQEHFRAFAPSYRTLFIYWVASAKKPDTRARRIARVVEMAAANRKPGML